MSALDTIKAGDVFKGVLEVFTSTTGDFFYFVLISMLCLLIYAQTQNAAFVAMVFIILAGALVGSHLTQFTASFGLVPEEFQLVVLGFVLLALTYVIWQAITKRTG
jgi:hypothetical protein